MLAVAPPQTLSMPTRDGIRLDADLYRPDAPGSFPVLLMRQPYGRKIASTVVYAHPSWYAAHGYLVVIQDVRGRGTSQGCFDLFAHEISDGYDSVQWAASLPNSSGVVGMYGFSYQAMTQLYAASAHPPALKTLCPAMMAYDLYGDMAYLGGAFRLQNNLSWAIQLAAETARLEGKETRFQKLVSAAQQLPLTDPIPARPKLLKKLAADSFYHDWLAHPEATDPYWQKLSPHAHLASVDLPMLHIGGWFDPYLTGTIHLFRDVVERSQHPQHLIVGPWTHLPWGRKVGSVDFGEAAVNPIDRLQIRWFDFFLKGIENGLSQSQPIRLFEMGSNQWREYAAWPQPSPFPLYLASSGLAAMAVSEGSLQPQAPAAAAADRWVADPWRPVPSLGGFAGPMDRSSLDDRSDVLTYTTGVFEQTMRLSGDPWVDLYVTADSPSFDIAVVLSEVKGASVLNFTQGYRRVNPGDPTQPLRIPLQPTCLAIPPGSALRLSISATSFPAFPVNPGTGSPPATARLIEAQVITLTLTCGGDTPSQLRLPML
ncbi:MAG: CocE/NonD family hydrolase [Cyanobacteriota bacterium]|nr:CocE/NonD family hydrolase [Cyanobacteriota bacterium]